MSGPESQASDLPGAAVPGGIDGVLGAGGLMARVTPGFEPRAGQLDLARRVAAVFEDGGVLLAEAGTGTGKTLAYLAAACVTGRTVVVSTATRNLQDQIVRKDVPSLERALGRPIEAAVLKGRQNYLCLWRLEQMRAPVGWGVSSDVVDAELERVLDWSSWTQTGDRAEVSGLPEEHPLWDRLTTTAETCLGAQCAFVSQCHVTRARAAAEKAKLLIVNHALYFGDLAVRAAGGALLPEHDAVVFDEAHAVAETAAQFFGAQVSSHRLLQVLDDVRTGVRSVSDLEGATVRADAARARLAGEALFTALRAAGGASNAPEAFQMSASVNLSSGPDAGRVGWGPADVTPALETLHLDLDSSLELLGQALAATQAAVEDRGGTPEQWPLLRRRVQSLRDDLARLLDPRAPDWVYFRESRGTDVRLSGQPIEAGLRFAQEVLERVPAVVLTSATLAVGGSFEYVRGRLGLDEPAHGERVEEATVESPFDYGEQARLYLPSGLPAPDAADFIEAVVAHVGRLTALTAGRAFVLFTSHRNLEAAHRRLTRPAEAFGWPLLRQGDAPRAALVERFRATPGAVLLGTGSFWEGVDVPGDALSLVVIDKLPFEPPNDPVLQARAARFAERGGQPFMQMQVPAAALALKQGFGRLIRVRGDRGIVAVLDSRLTTKGYGKRILAALPPAPVVRTFEELQTWWRAPN